jgi:hypothetical protein
MRNTVLISEFLNTDQLEDIENNQVEELIIECLSKIHVVYGFNDGWNNPEEWVFDELNKKEEELNGIKSDEFITNINKSFFEMSGSVMTTMYQPKSLFQYKKRPLFKVNEHTVTHNNYRIIPLLLAMKDLIRVYKEETPDSEVMVRVTRLIECYDKIYMMVSLNCLWICETTRNYDPNQVDDKNVKHDLKPMNKLKKVIVFGLVNDELNKDKSKSITDLVKLIKKPFENKIDTITLGNTIPESDLVEFLYDVKPTTFKRWVTEAKNNT